mmetsp:Transcript_36036/g.58293  ORF Transcript_36036/g.58293 Transcript_36036/m.58293 type:complete len:441 (-) Transcript_36036:57-1379(-)
MRIINFIMDEMRAAIRALTAFAGLGEKKSTEMGSDNSNKTTEKEVSTQSRAGKEKDGKKVNSIPVSMAHNLGSKKTPPLLQMEKTEIIPHLDSKKVPPMEEIEEIPEKWGYLESENKESYDSIDLERHGKENEFMLGRDQFPQFPEYVRISRQHIRLFTLVKDGVEEAWIENKSANGTRLNSEPKMEKDEKRKIRHGTKITIAGPFKKYPEISFTFKRVGGPRIGKELHVFWDIENCRPSSKSQKSQIGEVLKEIKNVMYDAFHQKFEQSYPQKYTIQTVYANKWDEGNERLLDCLQKAGVECSPIYSEKKQAADIGLMEAMTKRALPGDAAIGIITGDSDYMNHISALNVDFVITKKNCGAKCLEQFNVVGRWPLSTPSQDKKSLSSSDQIRASLNEKGYPLRPGREPCSYYMNNGTCGYGAKCCYDHPPLNHLNFSPP